MAVTLSDSGRVPNLAQAKVAKIEEAKELEVKLIEQIAYREDAQYKDEAAKSETHELTEDEIIDMRNAIRTKYNSIVTAINALTTIDAVQAYKIEY